MKGLTIIAAILWALSTGDQRLMLPALGAVAWFAIKGVVWLGAELYDIDAKRGKYAPHRRRSH